jgi:hypothetical protein
MSARGNGHSMLVLVLGVAIGAGCASTKSSRTSEPPPWDSTARWRGPAADAAAISAREPATPALRALRGRMPLLHLAQGPWSEAHPEESAYEITLFDDGTLVYEGHRCVKLGGLVVAHLDAQTVAGVKELLADSCVDLDRSSDNEVCDDSGALQLACSNGRQLLSGSDHCRRDEDAGKRIDALGATLLERVGAKAWLGEPTERQACQAGKDDLAPRETERFLAPPPLAGG